MAAKYKSISKRMTTPKGTARYPRLNVPDEAFGQSKYKVDLILDKKANSAFLKELHEFYKECLQHERGSSEAEFPLKEVLDEDGNKVPDKIALRFSLKSGGVTKGGKPWSQRPTLFDAKRNPIPSDGPGIGSGSTLRVSFEARSYLSDARKAGMSLRLLGAQVINLVEWSGGGASADEFDDEDGYEIGEAPADLPEATASDDDSGDF